MPSALLGATLLLVVTIGVDIAGTVTNEWLKYTQGGQDTTEGLWRRCTDHCQSLSDSAPLDAVRAVTVIGVIFGGLALIVGLVEYGYSAFKQSYNTTIVLVTLALVTLADVCSLVGVVVYVADYEKDREDVVSDQVDRGYSFWLVVAAIALYSIVAGCLLLAACQHVKEKTRMEAENDDLQKLEKENRIHKRRSWSRSEGNRAWLSWPKRTRVESRHQHETNNSGKDRLKAGLERPISHGLSHGYKYHPNIVPQYYKLAGYAMAPSHSKAIVMAPGSRAYALTSAMSEPKIYDTIFSIAPPASYMPHGEQPVAVGW